MMMSKEKREQRSSRKKKTTTTTMTRTSSSSSSSSRKRHISCIAFRISESKSISSSMCYFILLFIVVLVITFQESVELPLFVAKKYSDNGRFRRSHHMNDYSSLQSTQDIDPSIESRAQTNNAYKDCSRIFLYLPDFFANHGHGSQINAYILSIITATYLNRVLILLEPPPEQNKYLGGSQFGCPVDAFQESGVLTSQQQHELFGDRLHPDLAAAAAAAAITTRENFSSGFSRLIQLPTLLSHGCNVPCTTTYQYNDWAQIRWNHYGGEAGFPEVTCTNPDGSMVNVVVAVGATLRNRNLGALMMQNRQSPEAVQWAINLGASPKEAETFVNKLQGNRQTWDYVSGLMNKAGLLKFQPWIARDVELFLQLFDLPAGEDYTAIHVRRGDKLDVEAKNYVIDFWRSQGHFDDANLPTNYIPFVHYLNQLDGFDKCVHNDQGEMQILKHNVYVGTDDPIVVQQEIAELSDQINENTVLWNCNELKFYFSPAKNSTVFHLNGHGEDGFRGEGNLEDSCFARYKRNIVSIADLMILSRARTFIGEYNSNWGRLIRTLRVRLNDNDQVLQQEAGDRSDRLTITLDTRIAWGGTNELPPGF